MNPRPDMLDVIRWHAEPVPHHRRYFAVGLLAGILVTLILSRAVGL